MRGRPRVRRLGVPGQRGLGREALAAAGAEVHRLAAGLRLRPGGLLLLPLRFSLARKLLRIRGGALELKAIRLQNSLIIFSRVKTSLSYSFGKGQ